MASPGGGVSVEPPPRNSMAVPHAAPPGSGASLGGVSPATVGLSAPTTPTGQPIQGGSVPVSPLSAGASATPQADQATFRENKPDMASLLTHEVKIKVNQLRAVASTLERAKCMEPRRVELVEGSEAEGIPTMLMERGTRDVALAIPGDSVYSKQLTESLCGIGACLTRLVQDLTTAVEEQVLLVFTEHQAKLKSIASEEALVKKHRWPSDGEVFSLKGSVGRGGADPAASARSPPANGPQSPSSMASPSKQVVRTKEASLGATIHSLLESLASATETEKAMLYVRDPDANMLRCVAQVPFSTEAADVSLAATSLPVTVLQTGVAVHVAMGGAAVKGVKARHLLAFPVPGVVTGSSAAKGAAEASERAPRNLVVAGPDGVVLGGSQAFPDVAKPGSVSNTLCRGGRTSGVIVLQKHRKQSPPFRACDEWLAASAAIFVSPYLTWHPLSSVLQKYEPHPHKRNQGSFGSQAPPPPSAEADFNSTNGTVGAPSSVEDLLGNSRFRTDGVGDQLILRVPSRDSGGPSLKELHNVQSAVPTSIDAQLKECVTYIHNLELMWRNCLDEKRALQSDVERCQIELSERQVQLASMEANVKDLSKQYTKAKNDIQKITRSDLGHHQHGAARGSTLNASGDGRRQSNLPPLGGSGGFRRASHIPPSPHSDRRKSSARSPGKGAKYSTPRPPSHPRGSKC